MESLSQERLDALLLHDLDEVIAVRQQVGRIDEARDLLVFLEESMRAGEKVNVCLRNNAGIIYFSHWTDQPCPLLDRVLTECAGHLLRQRVAVLSNSVRPALLPAERNETVPVSAPADPGVWLTVEQFAAHHNIVVAYVSSFAKKRNTPKRRDGRRVLYKKE